MHKQSRSSQVRSEFKMIQGELAELLHGSYEAVNKKLLLVLLQGNEATTERLLQACIRRNSIEYSAGIGGRQE